jgi:hypothetical protein
VDDSQATLDRALAFMRRLAQAQIATWLSGGWAEELLGLCSPRPHHDIDLLYPAASFAALDQWLAEAPDVQVIAAKRFSHKRAMVCEQVMVEALLLEARPPGYRTNFFDGAFQLDWPASALGGVLVEGQWAPVASAEALQLYRRQHHRIVEAYHVYAQTRGHDR